MADIEITARDLKYPGKSQTLQINKSMAMEDLRNLVRQADPAWNQEYLTLYLEDEQQRLPLSFVSELKDGDLLMVEAINKDAPPSMFIACVRCTIIFTHYMIRNFHLNRSNKALFNMILFFNVYFFTGQNFGNGSILRK